MASTSAIDVAMGAAPTFVYNSAQGPLALANFSNGSNTTVSAVWTTEFKAMVATIISVSMFLNIVGNSMVLTVLIKHRGMRTRTNLFLGNLAVADLFVGFLAVPFSITTLVYGDWVFPHSICLLNGFMNCFCLVTSIHTLMYIAIHKYFSIIYPERGQLEVRTIVLMMAGAWVWAAACATMTVMGLGVEFKSGTSQCGPSYPSNASAYVIHGVLQVTVLLGPMVIVLYCYLRMYRAIQAHARRLRDNARVPADRILAQQKKVALTMFIVLACFIVMDLPYLVYATHVTITKDKGSLSNYMNPVAYAFLFMNSMVNPIIYALRSPAFREGYKEILCQSPNYIVVDESERSGRMSSLMATVRRFSSISFNQSIIDPEPDLASSPRMEQLDRKKGRKSILNLLRSTRQSDAQTVVHRNGDTIIMKRGKIVSVKRGNNISVSREGSPLLDRLGITRPTSSSCGNNSIAAALTGPGNNLYDMHYNKGDECKHQRDSGMSVGSDDVFPRSYIGDGVPSKPREVPAHMTQWPEVRENKHFADTNHREANTHFNRSDNIAARQTDRNRNVEKSLKRGPDILIKVDDDDHILSVMPLSPTTKDALTRSATHIPHSHTDSEISQRTRPWQRASPSQNRLARPPSIERLDLPPHLASRHARQIKRRSSDTPQWSAIAALRVGPSRTWIRPGHSEV